MRHLGSNCVVLYGGAQYLVCRAGFQRRKGASVVKKLKIGRNAREPDKTQYECGPLNSACSCRDFQWVHISKGKVAVDSTTFSR